MATDINYGWFQKSNINLPSALDRLTGYGYEIEFTIAPDADQNTFYLAVPSSGSESRISSRSADNNLQVTNYSTTLASFYAAAPALTPTGFRLYTAQESGEDKFLLERSSGSGVITRSTSKLDYAPIGKLLVGQGYLSYMKVTQSDGTVLGEWDGNQVLNAAGDGFISRTVANDNPALADTDYNTTFYDISGNDNHGTMTNPIWEYISAFDVSSTDFVAGETYSYTAPPGFEVADITLGGVSVPYADSAGSGTISPWALGDVSGFVKFSDSVELKLIDSVNGNEAAIDVTWNPPAPYVYKTFAEDPDTGNVNNAYYQWTDPPLVEDQTVYDPAYYSISGGRDGDGDPNGQSGKLTVKEDAPASFAVTEYLIDGNGMQEFERNSGTDGNTNAPPTVDAGAPRTATVGDTVQFGTNVTITEGDGTIDSLLWTQQAGPTVSINNAGVKNASATFSQAGSYEFPLTATDSNGETGSDVLYITVSEAVTDSTLNLTVTGIGTGSRSVVLHDRTTREVVYDGSITFTNDEGSVTLTDVAVGTSVYGAYFGSVPLDDGTGLYGVTE